MLKLIICAFLLCGVARAMDDPLIKPLPSTSGKMRLAPLVRTGAAVIVGLFPASGMAPPPKKVGFNMRNLVKKLSERDLVSPDVPALYGRDKSDVGFLETGSELIESVAKYGQIRRLRTAKPGTQLRTLRASMTDGLDASSSPRAFSGVIFSPKPKDRSTLGTSKPSLGKVYRPRVLSSPSCESAFGDDGQLPVRGLLPIVDIPGDSDTDE